MLGQISGQGRGLGQIAGGCASARANFRLGARLGWGEHLARARTRAKGSRVMEDIPAESLLQRELHPKKQSVLNSLHRWHRHR